MDRGIISTTIRQIVQWVGGVSGVVLLGTGLMAWQQNSATEGATPAAGASKPAGAAVKRAAAAAKTVSEKPLNFDIAPETNVDDPYPTYNGIAVDPENNIVAMSDLNRHG